MTDAPEYHTKPLSPLSPLPVHPPEPSNIPVLRNQIDPIFNMTSTHIEVPHPTVAALAESNSDPIASTFLADGDSPADSSFSDAYKEEMDGMEHAEAKKDSEIPQQTVTDDYAMTFDSDGEEHSDSQDMSHENIEQDSEALPVSLSLSEIPYSSISRDIPATDTQIGQDTEPTTTSSPPIYPPTVDAAAPSPSESASSQLRVETSRPHTHTYEAIANGEIDIQQLLDNITANAEKNEAASAAGTPTSAIPSSASLPKAGSSLPTHSSLPPRPQVPRSNYTDDISKYHAGAQAVNTYRPPPGVNVPLNAAAAPGTYTDRRNGLPPPPSASFRQSSIPLGSPISPSVHPSASHFPGQDQPMRPGSADDINDADVRWGPDVQKKYDNFLIEERMYVTEGQWDRFPNGSRLFIGEQICAIDCL
jgi:nuclear polyadenylated RNA-binding protein 3